MVGVMNNQTLAYYLQRTHNNFDLLRIIMALLVIIHHAPALSQIDIHLPYNPFLKLDFGNTPVAFFFFLSGLVVTNSFIARPQLSYYLIARIFRIWPALICVLVVTTFIIGPLVSTLEPTEYFNHKTTWDYFLYNLQLKTRHLLPGVFLNNAENSGVNGSIWTIKWEVRAYLYLLLLLIPLVFSKTARKISIFFMGLFLLVLSIGTMDQQIFGNQVAEAKPYFLLFFIASFLCLLKEQVRINGLSFCLTALALACAYYSNAPAIIMLILAALLLMHLAFFKPFLRLKPKYDISYGVYIWAFPIAQTIEYLMPNLSFSANISLVFLVSGVVGYGSWMLIEQPCINLGKKISTKPLLGQQLRPPKRKIY